MTLNEQKVRLASELYALDRACSLMCGRMHYCTVSDILRNSGLPYELVQDDRDMLGNPIRGYRYRFTAPYESQAMLYVQETPAGRQHRSMRMAIGSLRTLLEDRLGETVRTIKGENHGHR